MAEQVVLAEALQAAAGESSKQLNARDVHDFVVGVADIQRPDGRSITFELFAVALQPSAVVVTKLARTSTALAVPAAACS